MANDLCILALNRKGLLLAEAAAWLHDWKKCSEEHLKDKSSAATLAQNKRQGLSHSYLTDRLPQNHIVVVAGNSMELPALIMDGRKGHINQQSLSPLVNILRRCHGAAHVEKEIRNEDAAGRQHHNDTRISSPFGFEGAPLTDLTARLNSLPWSDIGDREKFQLGVSAAFLKAPGDTRRPINEVTLWDWSGTVAALYKAALAGVLLRDMAWPTDAKELRWRLLSVRIDGAKFAERVSRIPDVLVRRKLLHDGLDRVQTLLEFTYPLGTEVYRDENGSVFVVPDVKEILNFMDGSGEPLRQLIQCEFAKGTVKGNSALALAKEIVPKLHLDAESWAGHWFPDYGSAPSSWVPPLTAHTNQPPLSPADPNAVSSWWSDHLGDICSVCGLRPQGPGNKAKERRVCDVCEGRREDRSKEWAKNLGTTIWIDEVADANGRIALIAGSFGIDEWLKPDGMVQTLFARPPRGIEAAVPKNPSFARLRRVWETTRGFWEEIREGFPSTVGSISPRLRIFGTFEPELGQDEKPAPSHAYELKLETFRLGVVCVQEGEFLTAENLLRLARLLGAPQEFRRDYCTAAMYVRDRVQPGKSFSVQEPTGYGRPRELKGNLRISSVGPEATPFTPAIPILADPRSFMALLPADRAMQVIGAIKSKYETEMGKVRNRLPMTLGLVFAGSRTPLAAVLNAGRRMLTQPHREETWALHANAEECGCHSILTFTNGITWRIPIMMGDGTTKDEWYPYFFVEGTPLEQARASHRDDGRWLVHVSGLKRGEKVVVTPSRFDFEFLDTAARRFEVSYNERGKRRDQAQSNRPYYLEDLNELERLWKLLSETLSTSQIKNLEGLVEAKRLEWDAQAADAVFQSLVRDVLGNAKWEEGAPSEFDLLHSAAVDGRLADVIELHMDVLKEKTATDVEEVNP